MNRVALMAGLLVAGVGVALLFLYMQRFEAEASGGEPVEVLVMAVDVPAGEALVAASLASRLIPTDYVEERHVRLSDKDRILGIRTSTDLKANQSLLWSDLETTSAERRHLSNLLRQGMRAMTINVADTSSFGGLLRAGDRVDVLLTATRPGTEDERVTISLLQNVLTLAVGADTGGPDQSEEDEAAAQSHRTREVSVAVTLEQATTLTHARDRGQLQLVLRNPDDITIVDDVAETTDTDLIEAEERIRRNYRRPAEGIQRIGQ